MIASKDLKISISRVNPLLSLARVLGLGGLAATGRELLVLWSIGTLAGKLIPHSQNIWNGIDTGKKILNFLGDLPEWVNYDKNLEENMQSLKETMEHLSHIEEDVEDEVARLELRTDKKRKREVDNWMRNVKSKDEKVKNMERGLSETSAPLRFIFRAWLGKCVESEKAELKELLEQKISFGSELVIRPSLIRGRRMITCALVGVVANETKQRVFQSLIERGTNIIGVQGAQGMGKTIIMMHLYNQLLDCLGGFDRIFYVDVSKDSNVDEIQNSIAAAMELQDIRSEHDRLKRAAGINHALELSKRFVLILDGLASHFRLEEVGIGQRTQGKLVVVSRHSKVCRIMGCRPVFELSSLPYEDSYSLFMEKLKPSRLSPEVECTARDIIHRCDGLPSRIIDVAESMIGFDDPAAWRVQLCEMGIESVDSNSTP